MARFLLCANHSCIARELEDCSLWGYTVLFAAFGGRDCRMVVSGLGAFYFVYVAW